MTLPHERTNSLLEARSFLLDLLDSKATPRVPKEIRKRARDVLRHFPTPLDLEEAGSHAPAVFSKFYKINLSGRGYGRADR